MSIIKGRFIYHAFYNSVKEMKNDLALEVGYFVSVIDEKNKRDYKIVDKKTEEGQVYESLDNGLYALSVILTNDTTVDVTKPYKTIGPTEADVGQIKEGTEFEARDTNDVFDLIFYKGWNNLTIRTNFADDVLVRGENHVLTYIQVDVLRAVDDIIKEEITVDGETQELEEVWTTGGSYRIPYDHVFTSDLVITLKVYSRDGEDTYRHTVSTQYPAYVSSINPDILPTPVVIKTFNSYFDNEIIYNSNYVETSYFIAVPKGKKLKSLIEENQLELVEDVRSYPLILSFGSIMVEYTCYYSIKILADNVSFVAELEDDNE